MAWHALIQNPTPRWEGIVEEGFHTQYHGRYCLCRCQNLPFEDTENMAEHHVCWICQKEFGSFTAWGSHSFKVHGRTNACRHLQEGSICQSCGKMYPSPERLVRHLRTHAPCRQTLAAQRGFFDAQPYYGSRDVQARIPMDSMNTWLPTSVPVVPRGDGWPMTSAMWSCLRILAVAPWETLSYQRIEEVFKQLSTFPVHRSELLHHLASMDHHYQGNPNALRALASLTELVQDAFTPQGAPIPKPARAKKAPTSWLEDLRNLYFVRNSGPSRMPTKLLYVVHLFSGTKRRETSIPLESFVPSVLMLSLTPISATCYHLANNISGFQWRYVALSTCWWRGHLAKCGQSPECGFQRPLRLESPNTRWQLIVPCRGGRRMFQKGDVAHVPLCGAHEQGKLEEPISYHQLS